MIGSTFKIIFEVAQKTAEIYELSLDLLLRRCGRFPRWPEDDVLGLVSKSQRDNRWS